MEFFGIQPSLLRGLAEKSHYKKEIHNWLKLILVYIDLMLEFFLNPIKMGRAHTVGHGV